LERSFKPSQKKKGKRGNFPGKNQSPRRGELKSVSVQQGKRGGKFLLKGRYFWGKKFLPCDTQGGGNPSFTIGPHVAPARKGEKNFRHQREEENLSYGPRNDLPEGPRGGGKKKRKNLFAKTPVVSASEKKKFLGEREGGGTPDCLHAARRSLMEGKEKRKGGPSPNGGGTTRLSKINLSKRRRIKIYI